MSSSSVFLVPVEVSLGTVSQRLYLGDNLPKLSHALANAHPTSKMILPSLISAHIQVFHIHTRFECPLKFLETRYPIGPDVFCVISDIRISERLEQQIPLTLDAVSVMYRILSVCR